MRDIERDKDIYLSELVHFSFQHRFRSLKNDTVRDRYIARFREIKISIYLSLFTFLSSTSTSVSILKKWNISSYGERKKEIYNYLFSFWPSFFHADIEFLLLGLFHPLSLSACQTIISLSLVSLSFSYRKLFSCWDEKMLDFFPRAAFHKGQFSSEL